MIIKLIIIIMIIILINNSRKNVQENITNDKISTYNWNNNEDINNLNNIPKTGKIMNENLFKHRTSKDIRGVKRLSSFNTENVNNFNNQIINNQNWGETNSVNNPRKSISNNTIKKIGEVNLRTRKK